MCIRDRNIGLSVTETVVKERYFRTVEWTGTSQPVEHLSLIHIILNIILAGFCDEAVTVRGLYYKLQSFFFIPLDVYKRQ